MTRRTILLLCLLLLSPQTWAKDLYVSTTGDDSVTYANNDIDHPWETVPRATSQAQAGDTVYFRAGTYPVTSQVTFANAGSDGSPIRYTRYGSEVVTIQATGSYDNRGVFNLRKSYVEWSYINFITPGQCFFVGYDATAQHCKFDHCTHYMTTGGDNHGFVHMYHSYANYTEVTNCTIHGPASGYSSMHGNTGGVVIIRTPILTVENNHIYQLPIGIYYKHGNTTVVENGIQVNKNYFHHLSRYGMEINSQYGTFAHNIFGASCARIRINESNGGAIGDHNTLSHNTCLVNIRLSTDDGGADYNDIQNSIFSSYTIEAGCDNNVFDYNMYVSGAAIGAHDIGNTSPTYKGGSAPTTILGFELAEGSAGKGACSDGSDMGANVFLVGPDAGEGYNAPPSIVITSPTSALTYDNGSTGTIDLSGTCSDDSAVTSATWENAANSTSGTCTLGDPATTWSVSGITLLSGSNIITVHAYDSEGLSGSDTITVTYTPADTTAPAISITSPTENATYDAGSATTIDISGTASDAVGVDHVTWENDRGGAGTCTGTTSWSQSGIDLYNGTNIITVTAYDAANNYSSDTLTVTSITPPPPNHPPVTPKVVCVQADDDDITVGDTYIFKDELADFSGYYDTTLTGLAIDETMGFGGSSTSAKFTFTTGAYRPGNFMLVFGQNPLSQPLRNTEDFTDVYVRFYVLMDSVTQNYTKTSRMSIFHDSDWTQACVGHVWGQDGSTKIQLDPASGVDGSTVVTSGWNDVTDFDWLGVQYGGTDHYAEAHRDRWTCIEYRMRLNTPGSSDGIFQLWVDGELDAQITGLNWRGSYETYGLNMVNFEGYMNNPSDSTKHRWFDNVVVSTARIGLAKSPVTPVIYKTVYSDSDLGDEQTAINAQVSSSEGTAGLVWDGAIPGAGDSIQVNSDNGTFQGALTGQTSLWNGTTYYARVRVSDGDDYSAWSDWYPLVTDDAPEETPTVFTPKIRGNGLKGNGWH